MWHSQLSLFYFLFLIFDQNPSKHIVEIRGEKIIRNYADTWSGLSKNVQMLNKFETIKKLDWNMFWKTRLRCFMAITHCAKLCYEDSQHSHTVLIFPFDGNKHSANYHSYLRINKLCSRHFVGPTVYKVLYIMSNFTWLSNPRPNLEVFHWYYHTIFVSHHSPWLVLVDHFSLVLYGSLLSAWGWWLGGV